MSRVYGDPVEVWTDRDGRPARFVWRERLHVVRRVLEHWVASRDWWRDHNSESAAPVAREFWRVEATPDREIGVYELRHDPGSGAWMLSRAWD
ncbi:MAG: DUF6504 family protein [Streptosporangiaceae bacterium]